MEYAYDNRSIALVLAAFLVSAMVVFTPRVSLEQKRLSPTEFFENGTGIVYFANGTVLHFNHTLTPQNGYLYENGTIHYASNGTQVDLTKVDRNSLIITDIIQPQQQQQQPPPPTTDTTMSTRVAPINPNGTSVTGTPRPLTAGTPTTDPDLIRFNQIAMQCAQMVSQMNPLGQPGQEGQFVQPNQYGINSFDQCLAALKDGIQKYCENFETYDAVKCAYINTPQMQQFISAGERIVGLGSLMNGMSGQDTNILGSLLGGGGP